MRERRKFLRSVGALASLGAVGTVSANRRKEALSTEAAHQVFHAGVNRNGADGARGALENLGLDPTIESTQDFELGDEDDQEVTPEWAYDDPEDSDSELLVSVTDHWDYDDEVYVSIAMRLRDCTYTVRNSWWIDDAIGVGFIESDWAPMGEPAVSATQEHTARYTEEDVASDALAGTVNIVDHADWYTGCDTGEDSLPDATVTLSGRFRLRATGEPSTLWGSYSHTIAAEPYGAIDGITGGYGGISVSTSNLATSAWSIAHPMNPDEEL